MRTSWRCSSACAQPGTGDGLIAVASELWGWLAAEEHRGLLTLWVEGYARSLIDPSGPWVGFAATTVADWLDVLAESGAAGEAEATLVLAVLRGAMLDLLATGDVERTTGAREPCARAARRPEVIGKRGGPLPGPPPRSVSRRKS